MKHKNIALIVLVASLFLLLASHHTVAAAAGTTVKLTLPNLPGGSWTGARGRIRYILSSIEGVSKYHLNTASSTVTVTFDDKKISADKIIEKLSKGGYPISAEPR